MVLVRIPPELLYGEEFWVCPTAPRETQGFYLSAGLGTPRYSPGGAEGVCCLEVGLGLSF